MRLVLCLLIAWVLTLSLIGAGGYLVVQQQTLIQHAKLTTATITALERVGPAQVKINFEYRANRQTFTSSRFTPLPDVLGLSRRSEVDRVLQQHTPGSNIKVYVSTDDPAIAYVWSHGYAYPYLLIFLGLAVAIISWHIIRRSGAFQPAPFPIRTPRSDWYVLPHTALPIQAMFARLGEATLWLTVTAFTLGHYFSMMPATYDWTILLASLGLLFSLWPLQAIWRGRLVALSMGEPTLTMMVSEIHLDQPAIVRLSLPVLRSMNVREIRIALTCGKRTDFGMKNWFTTSTVAITHETLTPTQPFFNEFTFEVPQKKHRPSSPYHRFDRPRVDWQFELKIQPAHGPSYTLTYPIKAST